MPSESAAEKEQKALGLDVKLTPPNAAEVRMKPSFY
jgi:hypothetical protein